MTNNLRTDLANVKGLGSAKSGTNHWWHQRLTALFMIPLTIWLIFFINSASKLDLDSLATIMKKPYNTIPIIMLFVVALYHSMLGMQVVIEDYINCNSLRVFLIVLLQMFCVITLVSLVVALFYMMII